MTGRPSPGPSRSTELQKLIDWLLTCKGGRSFEGLARRCGCDPSTLRRAVDGRMPTRKAVEALAEAAGADTDDGLRLLAAAQHAAEKARVAQAQAGRAPYTPGRIASVRGLAAEMRRVRAEAELSLRALERKGAGDLPRRALAQVLEGKRLPSATLLTAFLAACHASEPVVLALTAARDRLDPTVPTPTPAPAPAPARQAFPYPCADADPAIQDALARQERVRDIKARCGVLEDEKEDWYERQLREEEARLPIWGMTEAEVDTWAAEAAQARAEALRNGQPDLRVLLQQAAARARPASPPPGDQEP